jgi:hypothetical protein
MKIDTVVTKLTGLAKKIAIDKGPLDLLGLFQREDSQGDWDLVIAAPWLASAERSSFEYVVRRLREVLTEQEMSALSRVVILEHGGETLLSLLERFQNTHGFFEKHFSATNGQIIKQAHIITTQDGKIGLRRTGKKSRRTKARKATTAP